LAAAYAATPCDESEGILGGTRNVSVLVVALLILGAILALLYRSASSEEIGEDEWHDFEHP
jgi:hypothetical protein